MRHRTPAFLLLTLMLLVPHFSSRAAQADQTKKAADRKEADEVAAKDEIIAKLKAELEAARAALVQARENAKIAEVRAVEERDRAVKAQAVAADAAARAEAAALQAKEEERRLAEKLAAQLKAVEVELQAVRDREAKAREEALRQREVAEKQARDAEALARLEAVRLDKEKEKKAADRSDEAALKYLRSTAELFVESAIRGDGPNTTTMLAKDYRKSIEEDRTSVYNWVSAQCPSAWFAKFEITSETVAPGGDEAVFRGAMIGEKRRGTFSIRVVKDKETGRYLVTLFSARGE
jgi:hypothetical protein